MTALRTTFYSYKGGVGRTLALLNVGALLAANGRKVVAVDLDLEAPGFGLSNLTRRSGRDSLGVSDLLRDRHKGGRREFREHCYTLSTQHLGFDAGNFLLMPTGTNPTWLSHVLPDLYRDPTGDGAELFLLLLDEIENALAPDFILIDSRTGRADIAGIALLELPQVIVAVCGLNEQNVGGMSRVLSDLRTHSARQSEILTLLALSPVPIENSLLPQRTAGQSIPPPLLDRASISSLSADPRALLTQRIAEIKTQLFVEIQQDFTNSVQKRFPEIDERDLFHQFPYDPLVPLTDELQIVRPGELGRAYGELADVIARARTGDPGLPQLNFKRRSRRLRP